MPDAQGRPLRADLDVKPTLLSNVSYDTVNNAVTVGLPAAIVLYVALAGYWGWPNTEAIVGSAAAIGVFLGVILKISSNRYQKIVKAEDAAEIPRGGFDGEVIINNDDPMVDNFRLVVEKTPQELMQSDRIVLKIDHQTGSARG